MKMISLATRRLLKSSFRSSVFNPLIFSFQSQQFPEPKPTLVRSLTPFHIGISNFEFGNSVRSLTNFHFVSHLSTSSFGSRENVGGEAESGFGDGLSDTDAEIDRIEREIESLSESLDQSIKEFEATEERLKDLKAEELDHIESESLVQSTKEFEAIEERLKDLEAEELDHVESESLVQSTKKFEAIEEILKDLEAEELDHVEWEKIRANRERLQHLKIRMHKLELNIDRLKSRLTDKPSVTWLLLWPCMWSITLAAPPGHLPDIEMLALFGFGALLLRGAKCSVNDLLYRDIDAKVGRTTLGPVGSNLLTPYARLFLTPYGRLFLLVGQTALGLLALGILLHLNDYCYVLAFSYLLLVYSYPLMKRFTFWRQASSRGLICNWGALLGWAAIKGNLDPSSIVLPLYASGVFWTLFNDAINAHQVKGGVKSTALRFGDSTKKRITRFRIASLGCLALSGFNAELGLPFYAFLAVASEHLRRQIRNVDLSSRADCNSKFVSNKRFGAIIFAGILAGKLSS